MKRICSKTTREKADMCSKSSRLGNKAQRIACIRALGCRCRVKVPEGWVHDQLARVVVQAVKPATRISNTCNYSPNTNSCPRFLISSLNSWITKESHRLRGLKKHQENQIAHWTQLTPNHKTTLQITLINKVQWSAIDQGSRMKSNRRIKT